MIALETRNLACQFWCADSVVVVVTLRSSIGRGCCVRFQGIALVLHEAVAVALLAAVAWASQSRVCVRACGHIATVCVSLQAILGDLDVGGGGGSDGLSGAAVGGIIAAAVALLLLFLAALFLFVRRRRQQRERADATKDLDLGLMDHDSDSLDGGLKVRAPAALRSHSRRARVAPPTQAYRSHASHCCRAPPAATLLPLPPSSRMVVLEVGTS